MAGKTLLGTAAAAALFAAWMAVGPASGVPPLPDQIAEGTGLVVPVQRHSSSESRAEREWDEERRRRRRCGNNEISVKGKQRPTTRLAEGSARTAWAEAVRFAYGEQYIDLGNAVDVRYRCSTSSPSLGLKRCELIALPCRPRSDRKD
jgi:hypothetical protein